MKKTLVITIKTFAIILLHISIDLLVFILLLFCEIVHYFYD